VKQFLSVLKQSNWAKNSIETINPSVKLFHLAILSLAIVSVFILFMHSAKAQVQFYGTDIDIDENQLASVEMTITFNQPVKTFNFSVEGSVEKLTVNSTAGPQTCSVTYSGVSLILCNLNLTQSKRTIVISFDTPDYVTDLKGSYLLNSDLSLNLNIDTAEISARLPEGKAIVGENVPNRISYPDSANILSDGRRIIVDWRFTNVTATQQLTFQIIYENIVLQPLFDVRIRYALIAGAVVGLATMFVYIRYFRKPEKVILSVLDEYERKVFDMIVAAGGAINQRKVVQETNLSKAKVSRVVKSLVNRGVIEVERMGRTNKLKVLKKKFMM